MAEIDKLLIEEIRSGADEAWMRFVDRFGGRLQAFVRKKIRDPATVEFPPTTSAKPPRPPDC